MLRSFASWTRRRLFWTTTIAFFIVIDAASYLTRSVQDICIIKAVPNSADAPQNYQCPTFDIFLWDNSAVIRGEVGRFNVAVIILVAVGLIAILQCIAYFTENWTPIGLFVDLQPIDKFTFSLVVIGIVTALIFQNQLDAMKAADRTTRKSFTEVQRAFIVVSGLQDENVKDANGKITAIKFTPIIRNSGNTPAKEVTWVTLDPFNVIHSLHFREFQFAANPIDPDSFLETPEDIAPVGRAILGPHDTLPLLPEFPINDRTFQMIVGGRISKFYFGTIHYLDLFSAKERTTKYCYTINSFMTGGDGIELTGPAIKVPAARPFPVLCPHWNCADDQCTADKQRYEEETERIPKWTPPPPPVWPPSPVQPSPAPQQQ